MNSNEIAKEFTLKTLIKFALPTVSMMLLLALYTVVDGIFVTRFVGTNAVSAVNIIWPAVNLIMGIGVMLATGGNAIVARKLGEGKTAEALSNFTLLVLVGLVTGVVIAAVGIIFLKPIALALGATDILLEGACIYGFYWILFAPFTILKSIFEYFFVTAGKPKLGLLSSILGGITNIVLDYVLVVIFSYGIAGAAIASVLSQVFPCILGVIFYSKKINPIHFKKPSADWRMLLNSCTNGSSEMITNVSNGITTFLFNIALLRFVGEDGVAAICIILYADMIMVGLYLGFTSGVAPVISYNYGSNNKAQTKRLITYCLTLVCTVSIAAFILIEAIAPWLIEIFVDPGTHVYDISLTGLYIFALGFILKGFNTFASGMFTAFSNGKVSALLSFTKNLLLIVIGIAILPKFFGINGIWMTIPFAETITGIMSFIFIYAYRKKYGYGKNTKPPKKERFSNAADTI